MKSLAQRPVSRLAATHLSPGDRFVARRGASFLRDWILALIALGLVVTASVFRSEPRDPTPGAPHGAQDTEPAALIGSPP
jgi:hypothetical protein